MLRMLPARSPGGRVGHRRDRLGVDAEEARAAESARWQAGEVSDSWSCWEAGLGRVVVRELRLALATTDPHRARSSATNGEQPPSRGAAQRCGHPGCGPLRARGAPSRAGGADFGRLVTSPPRCRDQEKIDASARLAPRRPSPDTGSKIPKPGKKEPARGGGAARASVLPVRLGEGSGEATGGEGRRRGADAGAPRSAGSALRARRRRLPAGGGRRGGSPRGRTTSGREWLPARCFAIRRKIRSRAENSGDQRREGKGISPSLRPAAGWEYWGAPDRENRDHKKLCHQKKKHITNSPRGSRSAAPR